VDSSYEDGSLHLNRSSYADVLLTHFKVPFVHDGKRYDGVEISTTGDFRDVSEGLFKAHLLETNEVMIQLPSTRRPFRTEYKTSWKDNEHVKKDHPAFKAASAGHEAIRAELLSKRVPNNSLLRVMVLTFPDFFTLSNEIFSPNSTELAKKVLYPTGYKYKYQDIPIQNEFATVLWYFHKFTSNPPKVDGDEDDGDQALDYLDDCFKRVSIRNARNRA
jgi:hypothetical protein